MTLNLTADGPDAFDMTQSDEFASLLASARDLSIPHNPAIRYVSRQIVTRKQRFHVLEWGNPDAPPLLLLHGGHQSAHSWDLVSLHLADRYHVFAPDQRGHGDSEWSRECAYSNEDMAEDARSFIDALGLQQPLVMGHSMGGRNTLLLALKYQPLCRGLVVVDVGPEISGEGRRAISSFVSANEEFENLDKFVENVRRYDPYRSLEHIQRTVKYNLFERADGKYISKCDRAPRRLGLAGRTVDNERLSLESVRDLTLPILLVRGESSNVLTPEAAARFVAALPHGELRTVPSCGHNVHSQNTLGFLDAINPFLDGLMTST
ncbi:MAG: alpha/beta hydrolase [Pseudomonadota bacterium]